MRRWMPVPNINRYRRGVLAPCRASDMARVISVDGGGPRRLESALSVVPVDAVVGALRIAVGVEVDQARDPVVVDVFLGLEHVEAFPVTETLDAFLRHTLQRARD